MKPISIRFKCFGPYLQEQFIDFTQLEKSGLFVLAVDKSRALGGAIHGDSYGIPYGCIAPKRIKNLLVCGRCISVDHIAHSSTRIQGTCVMTGQAAGAAAAVALDTNATVQTVDVQKVREALKNDGVLLRK